MHHGTCVTHMPWWMPGSLISGFIWSRWRLKRSRHSRRMRNPQFYVSGKRPIGWTNDDTVHRCVIRAQCVEYLRVIAIGTVLLCKLLCSYLPTYSHIHVDNRVSIRCNSLWNYLYVNKMRFVCNQYPLTHQWHLGFYINSHRINHLICVACIGKNSTLNRQI